MRYERKKGLREPQQTFFQRGCTNGQQYMKRFSMSLIISSVQFSLLLRLFVTPWTAAHQASLSITNSQSLLKFKSIESVMPSSHLILCCPLLLLPPIPPSIRVFSKWPKYWSFSFSISPSNEHPGLISFRMDWLDLLALIVSCNLNTNPNHYELIFHTCQNGCHFKSQEVTSVGKDVNKREICGVKMVEE